MAARLVRTLLRKNNISKYFFSTVLRKSRAIEFKNTCTSLSSISTRNYASKSSQEGQDDERDEAKKDQVTGTLGTVITQGPLGWVSKKAHMFLLKAYFDPEFDEEEFLRGAKQALLVTSKIIAEGRFEDMSKLCPPKFIDLVKDAVKTQELGPAIRAVDILMTKIKKIQLGYTEEQAKQVEIDVTFVCHPKAKDLDNEAQVVGNVKIVHIRNPRIVEYRFRKFCVPDEDSWLVVGINL